MTRGMKVLNAQKYGFKGCIIYSDPKDYTYDNTPVFPDGKGLPHSGYQRGSISSIHLCPGNLINSRAVEYCGYTTDETVPSIPALPLSYGNAQVLFESLTGPSIEDWQGGLNVTYNIGGNNDTIVNLIVNNELSSNFTMRNVVGFIKGTKYTNESIMIGNHRDAWAMGTADPISGTTVLLELARSFMEMVKQGWKPLRNIYFCSWDGEEFNLIGSTDYAEKNRNKWRNELIAYINVDVAASGTNMNVQASPALGQWAMNRMKNVTTSIYDKWVIRQDTNNGKSLNPNPFGSGSDYSSFLDYVGIHCINPSFSGQYGTYHSVYDSFTWMSIADPDWKLSQGMAQYMGLLALDLLNNDKYPFNVTNYYTILNEW
eukprot:CAMPEP_0114693630 /NCGR_PEP_ID=MMETSP0191-20121206/69268_1 /TAXON_ID=126664 /ORGANISM="Sorites sp." /LENGTH=371 /DNA_ID=CAMNT_0001987501 /DNA_START=167 /DNA_END=1279 /DNA_ORIENTATION=+